ncbi:hypothetical protein WA158_004581 [Blastocystis sp. Blastoise]
MSGAKKPTENFQDMAKGAPKKADVRIDRLFVSSILAGAYIGVGGTVAAVCASGHSNVVVSKILFSLFFPIALTIVVIAGSELFTGNVGSMTYGLLGKTTTWMQVLKNLLVSYIGNFVGSSLFVWCIIVPCGTFDSDPYKSWVVNLAVSKTSLSWGRALMKGIACNWLVNLALWMAGFYSDAVNKALCIWVGIFSFCALGFEHSVANMTMIPLGIHYGTVTWGQYLWNNLIPVTLGNMIGGSLLVAFLYWYILGCPNAKSESKTVV